MTFGRKLKLEVSLFSTGGRHRRVLEHVETREMQEGTNRSRGDEGMRD